MSELPKCRLCGCAPIRLIDGSVKHDEYASRCSLRLSVLTGEEWNLLIGGGEPVAWMYFVNGVHVNFSSFEPPDDAYDAGTLVPLYDSPQATQSQQIGWVHRNRIGNPSTSLLSDRIYRASVEDPDDYVPVYLHEIVDAVKTAMKGEG